MICPRCEIEYRDGIKRCADCDVDLVEEILPNAYEEALTALATNISSDVLAELTDRLEKASVPYVVEAGTALRLLDHPEEPMTKPDDWEARVWIASTFAERAERIYREIQDRLRLEGNARMVPRD
jgi:hypothetical protein